MRSSGGRSEGRTVVKLFVWIQRHFIEEYSSVGPKILTSILVHMPTTATGFAKSGCRQKFDDKQGFLD